MSRTQWIFLVAATVIFSISFFSFVIPAIGMAIWGRKKIEPNPKKYIVRAFSSAHDLEDYTNKMSDFYSAVSIADTDRYITVLLRRKD